MVLTKKNRRPKNALEGRYANYLEVGHNALEFLIDFGQSNICDTDHEPIHTRIVTSPPYAKRFLQTLSRAIKQYESRYGSIEDE